MGEEPRVNIQNHCHLPDIFLSEIHKEWMYQRGVNLPPDFKYEYSYPSTGTATLAYTVLEVAEDGDVVLAIYNLQGQLLETLVNDYVVAGKYSVTWNADRYSSGVYFLHMISGEFMDTQKLMLVK